MTAVASFPPRRAWLDLLRTAVARDTITAVAERVGVARSTLSLVLAGKYSKSLAPIERRVRDALDTWRCPHLDLDLAGHRCQRYRDRPMPRSSARELRHWRACQTCAHNPNAQTGD